jgi:ABC-type branched-subunit amino acid transport system ATPase component/branched-subunit amino acid ABC-type transport system permease component
MTEQVIYLLLGLGSGAVFAALAVSLVVTFRSSGVVNFSTGAVALYIAYTYAFIRQGELLVPIPGLPKTVELSSGPIATVPAMAISLLIAAILGLALYGLVFRPLRQASPVAKAVASIGIMLMLQGLLAARVGTSPVSVSAILPSGSVSIGSGQVPADRLWLTGTVLAIAALLTAMMRFTRFGLATRAVSETERGALVSGISPSWIAATNWALGTMVAGLSGILIAPIVPLLPISYTLFIVPALAAAMIGRFTNIGLAAAAGLAIGMLQSELVNLQSSSWTWLPSNGAGQLVPLVLILIVLVVRSGGIPQRAGVAERLVGHAPVPRNIPLATLIGLAVGVLALLLTTNSWRAAILTSIILAILALSQVVVTGYAGQVSLGQLTMAGASAFVLGKLGMNLGLPFPLPVLISSTAAMALGVAIGIPALRVRGLSLAVVTLALAVAVESVWFLNPDVNGGTAGQPIGSPKFFGLDLSIGSGLEYPRLPFCFACLAVLALVAIGVARLRRSALGAEMLAVRANERSAAASGIDVRRVKVLAFALGGFIAGLSGGLLAYQQQVAEAGTYSVLTGIGLFAIAYVAGISSVLGGIIAGLMSAGGLVYLIMDRWLSLNEYYAVLSGLLLVVTVIMNPEGLVRPIHRVLEKLRGRGGPAQTQASLTPEVSDELPPPSNTGLPSPVKEEILTVSDLGVTYGGVVALEKVSFGVNRGEILGIIGPNGAGKTTLIDAMSGFARYTGKVSLLSSNLDDLPPFRRMRRGLGRTFQSIELYDDLTVEENIKVGMTADESGDVQSMDGFLGALNLTALKAQTVSDLSQGQRQLVSVARALAGKPDVLLLDEPAAGLDSSESVWLGQRLKAVRDRGVTVVIIDHDMGLVLGICDRIVVLDLGRKIADDAPARVQRDAAVVAAYLGSTHAHEGSQPVPAGHGD